jgi:hypothetical protein
MTIEAAFLELMPSTVTWYGVQSTDAYGKRTFSGASNSQRCRIQQTQNMTRDAEGKTVIEDGKVYFYGTSTIGINDRLLLPDGTEHVILTVETRNDEDGAHSTVATFGRA